VNPGLNPSNQRRLRTSALVRINGLESDIAQGVPSTDLPPSKSSVRFEQEATWHRIYEWKEAAN
jgi:hypothetical protein